MRTSFKYDKKDKTITFGETLFFLKGIFANGFVLGFYSQDPCGCVRNQEVGWAIFDLKKRRMMQELVTRCGGESINIQGEWKVWMEWNKQEYGKLSYFKNEDGTHKWKVDD